MNKEELKIRLGEYNSAMSIIDSLIDEKNKYLTLATKTTQSYSLTPKGASDGDKIQTYPEKMGEIEIQIEEEIKNSKDILLSIMHLIRTVEKTQLREVLILKYIKGYTLSDIATKTNYSYKQACRMHGYALEAIKI